MAGYPGEISGVLKMRVEPGEEFLHRAGPHQGFPEPPDGRLGRRPRAVIEAEETAKAAPVHDLQRRLRIRQTVECLDHRHLDMRTGSIGGRPPCLPSERSSVASNSGRQLWPKELEVDNPGKPLQWISRLR